MGAFKTIYKVIHKTICIMTGIIIGIGIGVTAMAGIIEWRTGYYSDMVKNWSEWFEDE